MNIAGGLAVSEVETFLNSKEAALAASFVCSPAANILSACYTGFVVSVKAAF
jgi:hypothetical protein